MQRRVQHPACLWRVANRRINIAAEIGDAGFTNEAALMLDGPESVAKHWPEAVIAGEAGPALFTVGRLAGYETINPGVRP